MKDIATKTNLSQIDLAACKLCPRGCGVDRTAGKCGWCASTDKVRVTRAALHFWEEPPISGTRGSGTIFFSGCSLKCVFCQNLEISRGKAGLEVSISRLAEIMLELEAQGALNINLVTPMHYAPQIVEAIQMARSAGLSIPLVCNTGGYEKPSIVEFFSPYIDIWLTDFKYASSKLAKELSKAEDYPQYAAESLAVMHDSIVRKGGRKVAEDTGQYVQSIIVRHLVLPHHTRDSCDVLDTLWEIGQNDLDVSIMNQYTPNAVCRQRNDFLSETLSDREYSKVIRYAEDLGFKHIWWQESGTQSESFIPAFDTTGVEGPELDLGLSSIK